MKARVKWPNRETGLGVRAMCVFLAGVGAVIGLCAGWPDPGEMLGAAVAGALLATIAGPIVVPLGYVIAAVALLMIVLLVGAIWLPILLVRAVVEGIFSAFRWLKV